MVQGWERLEHDGQASRRVENRACGFKQSGEVVIEWGGMLLGRGMVGIL